MNSTKRTQPARFALASFVCLGLFAIADLPCYAGPSATLDSSFAIGTGAGFPSLGAANWGQVQAVAIQADGKVLAGGQALFTNFNGTPVPSFCRINVDGSLDTAFQANVGTGPLDGTAPEVNSIAIQPDGKILIGGPFTTMNGVSRRGLARLLTNGVVDTTFMAAGGGVNGTFTRYVNHVSLQADGKVLIAGGFNSYLGTSRPGVARLNSDGTLDTTFNPGSPAIFGANVVEAHSDGKIYVAGGFTNWLGLATPGIVRLHSNGSLDTSFIPTHSYPYPSIGAMSILGDGRVLIGGFVEGTEGNVTRYFARLNSDGSLDSGYPVGGVNGWVADIVPWPSGGHLIMGRFNGAGGQPRGELALIDNNGNVDLDFAPPPIPLAGQDMVHIYCAAVAPDGKIVVGGWFTNYPNNTQLNGQDYSGIARLIGGFTGGPGTIQFTSAAQQVSEDAGTITVSVSRFAGSVGAVNVSYTTVAGTASAGSDYTLTNGTLSWAAGELGTKTIVVPISSDVAAEALESFTLQLSAPTGGATLGLATSTITIVDDDSPPSIVTQPQNTSVLLTFNTSFRVVVGPGLPTTYQWLSNSVAIANATNAILNLTNVQTSFATSYSVIISNSIGFITSSNAVLTVLIPAGLPEPSFAMPGTGFNSDVSKIVFGTNGSMIVVGSFSQFGGVSIPSYIAKINANGSRDTSFPLTATGAQNVINTIAAYPDGRLLIGGNFTAYAGTSRSRVARLNADGSLDLTFINSGVSSTFGIYAVLPQADGSAYIGDSSSVRRFNATGTNDPNWTLTTLVGQVYALAQQADGKILAGPYRTTGGIFGSELIRLNTNGTRDLTFNSPGRFAGGQIQNMNVLPDGRIFVGGGFTNLIANEITNTLRYAAIFHPDGTLDTSFNSGTGPNGTVIDSFVQPDGRILVGGGFSTWNGVAANGFARVLPNGQIDPTFVIGTGINNSFVRAIAMDESGRIAIGGSFTAVNGQPRGRLALLTHDGGAVQLTSSSQRVNEQGGSVTVSIERVAGSRDALSVNYAIVAGTASSPADFTAASGLLTWANGEFGVKTFNVAINNDADIETDETFTVLLTNIVGGVAGLFTNQTIQILDNESAPRIASHPASLLVAEENTATFSVSAFSALPISYQWRSNGVNIVNATNSSFSLFNVVSNNAANYSVRVSNSVNFLDSSNAMLTVIASPTRRDASFVASPAFNGAVTAIYPLGDGRVMVGGSFTQPRTRIALLNANGTVDGSFTNTATALGGSPGVYDIERDGQGRWLIAGSFGQFGGVNASNLVRLHVDYSVDTNFLAALGRGPNQAVTDVAVGPNGKIWIAGSFTSIGGPFGVGQLARLNEDGSLDLSFTHRGGGNPTGSSGASYARVIPLPDGGALLGGSFNYYGGLFGSHLRKCFPDGSLNPSFTPSVSGAVSDMILLPDGSVIASGNFNSPSSGMVKFKPNGALDSSFLVGVTANDSVNSVALQSNGRIAGVGAFTSMGIHTNRFTRVNADGTQDSSLSLGSGFSGPATRVALEHTGEIWVGGAFTQYKGSGPGYLVRLVGDAPVVTIGQQPLDRVIAPGQNATFTITAAGPGTLTYQWLKNGSPLSNGGVISGANTANLTLTSVSTNDTGNYSIIVSNNIGAFATSRTASLQVKSDPSIVTPPAGGFVPEGGKISLSVLAEGAPTLSYQWRKDGSVVGGNAPIYTLNNAPITASGNYQVIVSNSFGAVTSMVAIVTVQATTATIAPGFFTDAGTAGLADTIYALQPLPDGQLMIGGTFSQIKTNGANNTFRQNIALFATNGAAASFNPSPDNQITDIVRQRDGKILVAGNFTTISNINRRYIARFNADLTLDTNFHNALFKNFSTNGPASAVNDIALQPDGKILLAGGFANVNGLPNTRGIARLNADGSVDESFVSGSANASSSSMVEVLPDRRILYSGNSYSGHNSALFRLSAYGGVDAGFTVSTDGSLASLAVQTNGAILLGGTFRVVNGRTNALLTRLIGNAQVDTNFLPTTDVSAYNQAIVRTISVQENGKILAGGNFLTFGPFRNGLARFNADGTPDSSFIFQQGAGDDSNANVWRISLFADGRIAIGGRFATWEGTTENGLAILNGDPVLLGFASQPVDRFVPTGTTVQFGAQAIGEPVIGYQWFRGISPVPVGANFSGTRTPTLTIDEATGADAGLYSLQISNTSGTRLSLPAELYILAGPEFREQPAGGTFYVSNSISLRATVLGLPSLSYQWLVNSNVISNATNSSLSFTNLTLPNSGNYQLVASNTLGAVTSVVATVTVLNSPATLSGTWLHPAGANSGIHAVAPIGDGRVMVGGSFTFAGTNGNQTARVNLALLNTNGTVDAGFNPAPDNRVNVIRRDSAGRFLVGGWFNNIGGQPRNYFARLNSDGSLDTNFLANLGTGPNGFVYDIAVRFDGKILVAGSFATVSGQSYPSLVRLNENGTIDSTLRLNVAFAQQVQCIALRRSDTKIYIGGFINVSNRQNLVRLESNGAVDLSFIGDVDGAVNRIISLSDNGVLVGGNFFNVNGTSASYLARLTSPGTLDPSWPQTRPNQSVQDIILQPNGKIVVIGSFNSIGISRNQIARYEVDGSLDTTFAPGTGFNFNTPRTLALESDGRIWVGGSFTTYNGTSVNNLVLLTADPHVPASHLSFEGWAIFAGLNAGNNAPGYDADNDGVPNVFEYYFGTSPTNAASSEVASGTGVTVGNETYPAIKFIRAKNIEGVTLLPQASSNVNFSDSLGTTLISISDLGGGLEEVTIRSSVSDSVQPTQFLRIQLSIP